tara:strand:+ start:277 stop:1503 length:1227 start_codon:yes stop_codon:yes gene_type:complete
MANTIVNLNDAPGYVSKLAAKMFADKVVFCKAIDQEPASSYSGINGYSSGDTIQISKPSRYDVGTSADITSTVQDVVEGKVAMALDIRKVVAIELTSLEIATDLALASWAKRILEPAISAMAQDVDATFLELAKDATFNHVGTPGSSTFNTALTISANQKITEFACSDDDDRSIILNPAANSSAVVARNGLFQASDAISAQYKKGLMGIADGMTFLHTNLLPTHVNGSKVTSVLVDGASQTGATLHVDGLGAAGTATKGSVFTIAGVNAVHPITKADQGFLQQFVITAGVTADGGGDADLVISPSIITTGTTQTVTAGPADNAAMVFVGTATESIKQNLAFYRSAFRYVSVPLVMPGGTDMASQSTVDGISIRVIRDYTVLTDKLIMRLDFLGGFSAVRPEWSVRLSN